MHHRHKIYIQTESGQARKLKVLCHYNIYTLYLNKLFKCESESHPTDSALHAKSHSLISCTNLRLKGSEPIGSIPCWFVWFRNNEKEPIWTHSCRLPQIPSTWNDDLEYSFLSYKGRRHSGYYSPTFMFKRKTKRKSNLISQGCSLSQNINPVFYPKSFIINMKVL